MPHASLSSRLRRSWERWKREQSLATLRRQKIGAGSALAQTVQVYGWSQVAIGRNSNICDDTLINALNCPGTTGVVIGDSCFIGRRNFLNAGSALVLGDYCLTGTDCHFLGSDHAYENPFVPYLAGGNTPGGEIHLGPNCWLGARVTVLKGVSIGFGSVIGASSVVTRDVPPLSIAVGNPARVIQRYRVQSEAWVKAGEFTAEDERQLPTEEAYLARLRSSHPALRMPSIGLGREFGDF
jgi:acetyltransferase-like isoleucine patch superfamily enzyme